MPRTSKTKAADDSTSDSDDHSNSEGDKLALRRARNRVAARKVRERRVNAIKNLSEQVEQLVAENQELRDKLAAAEDSTAREAKTVSPAVSVTEPPMGQTLQEATKQVETRSIATQTDAPDPAVMPEPQHVATEQQQLVQQQQLQQQAQQQLWNPLLQQLQQRQQHAGTSQDPNFHDQLQQHVLLAPGTAAQIPALFNLQQLQLMVQMQMQLLQLHNSASPASSSGVQLPSMMDQPQAVQQAAGSSHAVQAAGAGSSPYAAAAAAPIAADAWSAAVQQQAPQSLTKQQVQQQQQQQQSPQQLGNWGYMTAADTAQSSSTARAQQQQPQQQQRQQRQQPPLPPLPHRQQQQAQQSSMPPPPPQQQRQQPVKLEAAAAAASAAPAGPDGAPDEARFAAIPGDNVLCQLGEDDSILMSTDMNFSNSGMLNINSGMMHINTGDFNMNTADLNFSNSSFNAMVASEELLRHVPTPEEATASRSTAWL